MDGIKERLRAITPEPEGHILLHKAFTGLNRDDASKEFHIVSLCCAGQQSIWKT